MEDRGYVEVETPVFHPIPGGALARPFVTHHNALDLELYLRVAPELYLKRLVVGGMPKVFEIARVFRNEGLSTRHNPEFTMLEAYEAYGDYHVHMELTEQLVAHLALALHGIDDRDLRAAASSTSSAPVASRPAGRADQRAGRRGRVGAHTVDRASSALRRPTACPTSTSYGPGKLLLELYEKTAEHTLWEPTFVIDYPKEVSPLSREHRDDPLLVERFEAIVGRAASCATASASWSTPTSSGRASRTRPRQHDAGDDEAMVVDEDYLRALEYGLPPTVGLGIGIDRLVMLLTDTTSIRDVVLFPTLRPEQAAEQVARARSPRRP